MNVGFISLGCSKNLVDTEIIIGKFKSNNFKIVNSPKEADVLVINTCGFIEPAKQESIDTILEMSKYKTNGRCKCLIVIGCLVKRYKKELEKSILEVDLFLSIEEYNDMWNKVESRLEAIEPTLRNVSNEESHTKLRLMPSPCHSEPFLHSIHLEESQTRVITTGENFAYLKIAEGCSNHCTYCAIPMIRGNYISRPFEEIIKEAKRLVSQGIKEIIVIAQDTTKYGIDLYGKQRLPELLEEISKIKNLKWLRFLYAYPESITEELIDLVKNNNKICKYFDIPIQHISDSVLKRMNRKSDSKSIKKLIKNIRKSIPNVTLRTSLIVGFPGETEEDFEKLYNFVKWAEFDKLGVFKYSKEENTPAEKLKGHIHYAVKEKRYKKIMEEQQKISKKKLEQNIGKELNVLIESKTFDLKYLIGRTEKDVPEIDGVVFIKNENIKTDLINKFVKVEITNIKEYDLIGKIK